MTSLEKIKKLLRLAQSGNPHEAELAMAHALRIAAREGIDLAGVDPDSDRWDVTHKVGRQWRRIPKEAEYASLIVGAFFNVKTFSVDGVTERYHALVGLRSDVEIALYVYSFLLSHFRRSWNRRKNRRLRNRNAYLYGMYVGLWSKLSEQRPPAGTRSIVPIFDRYIADNWGRLTTSKVKPVKKSAGAAIRNGFGAGRNTEINPAIREDAFCLEG